MVGVFCPDLRTVGTIIWAPSLPPRLNLVALSPTSPAQNTRRVHFPPIFASFSRFNSSSTASPILFPNFSQFILLHPISHTHTYQIMAPTRPARATKENGTPSKAADASEAPVKRGRGRPPKNGIAAQPKKVPSGRPRGRPPGTGGGVKKAVAKKPTATAATGTGRRGRPAKNAVTTPSKPATPKASSAKSKAKGSATKGRKPRKSDAAEEPEEEIQEDVDSEADDAAADADLAMDDDDAADDDNPGDEDVGLSLED
ncbi:hypothetical protein F4860DRAFT_496443 [Xylaria cubensis]|nr:hypothetical protein F4860DRAFT_496443 [Xylaria cubensis]